MQEWLISQGVIGMRVIDTEVADLTGGDWHESD